MQDDGNERDRQGYPASEGGSAAGGPTGDDTRRMDASGGQGGQYNPPAGEYNPPAAQYNPPGYQPPQPPQWNAPYQPAQPPPYNPPVPITPQPPQQYQYQAPGPAANTSPFASIEANPPLKDTTTAMLVEIGAGLIGLLGLGHILSGRVIPGIVLLVSWWAFWGFGFLLFSAVTLGLGCFCAPVFWLGGPIASAFWLKQELDKRYGPRRLM